MPLPHAPLNTFPQPVSVLQLNPGQFNLDAPSRTNQTYINSTTPAFVPLNGGTANVSTLVVNKELLIKYSPSTFMDTVVNSNGVATVVQTTDSQFNVFGQQQVSSAGDLIASYTQGFTPGSPNFELFYGTGDPTVGTGSIQFLSSINGASGGIQVNGKAGEYMVVGDGNASLGTTTGNNGITVNSNGILINPGSNNSATLQDGSLDVNNKPIVNVSSINGSVYPPPVPLSFLIYNLTPGSTVATSGTSPVVVATKASSVAGKAYRVTCVYDVTFAGTTALGDYSELQITGTGVSVFSMCTSTYKEIDQSPAALIVPGNSKTSTAVFVDADGGGFNVEIIANSPTALFSYTFYSVSVEEMT